jgi:uncharacterized protein (DUF1499 family)
MLKFPGTRPTHLGAHNGQLAVCPSTPNCVHSQTADPRQTIAPLAFSGAPAAAMQKLRAVVEAMPRTTVIDSQPNYLYVECSTPFFGFVDDVEFYNDGRVIQVRSASRLGYSDFGVNRKRVEAVREAFWRA